MSDIFNFVTDQSGLEVATIAVAVVVFGLLAQPVVAQTAIAEAIVAQGSPQPGWSNWSCCVEVVVLFKAIGPTTESEDACTLDNSFLPCPPNNSNG